MLSELLRPKWIIFILLMLLALKQNIDNSVVVLGPGVTAPDEPVQQEMRPETPRIYGEYQLQELATFQLTAKVLAKENYHLGREADLSPTDLMLGWRNMSDESVLQKIEFSQYGRFGYWRVNSFPIPRRDIELNSANMHIIPANKTVEKTLKRIRPGQVIELDGVLVNAKAQQDNWYWNSSTTRQDTGAGACEIVLVSHLHVVM